MTIMHKSQIALYPEDDTGIKVKGEHNCKIWRVLYIIEPLEKGCKNMSRFLGIC